MAMRKIVRKKRAPRRKAAAKRRGGMRRKTVVGGDYAKCSETVEDRLVCRTDATGESIGDTLTFCLQDYQRAQEIAHAYKWYRAKSVEITFLPYYNMAQTGGPGNTDLPQIYFGVDRLANRFITPTEGECLERGMKPHLFSKKMRLVFKPNLLQGISLETRQPADGQGTALGVDLVGYQNSVPLFNKWLPTQQSFGYNVLPPNNQVNQVLAPMGVNPYALKYYGAIWNTSIENAGVNATILTGDYQTKITWEFKGPRALATLAPKPEDNTYVITSSQGNPGVIPNTQATTYP